MAAPSSRAIIKRKSPEASVVFVPSAQPPDRRIKRPREVLEEEDYESGLEHIIRRDFFPGLAETDAKREYLAALESGDPDWISEAGAALKAASLSRETGHSKEGQSSLRSGLESGHRGLSGDTPTDWIGDTPRVKDEASKTASEVIGERREAKPNLDLGLETFQQKYTSEDNESFYRLLDHANEKRAQKHAYLWNGTNRITSARQIEEERRQKALLTEQKTETDINGRQLARIELPDGRPAVPDTWLAKPNNSFMFFPESVEDVLGSNHERATAHSRMGDRAILTENTRMPPPPLRTRKRAEISASPSLSAVRDAVHGRPRLSASIAGSTAYEEGAATPRVNGWAFVDSEQPEPKLDHAEQQDKKDSKANDDDNQIDLGPGDASVNPFRIRAERKREVLHDRMLERMKRQKLEKQLDSAKTPVRGRLSTPGSLSRIIKAGMSPAAQRLLGSVGKSGHTPASSSASDSANHKGSALGNAWATASSTPRARPSLAGVTPRKKN